MTTNNNNNKPTTDTITMTTMTTYGIAVRKIMKGLVSYYVTK